MSKVDSPSSFVNCCPHCGGFLIGDGFTTVVHCEFASEHLYEFCEPDAGPVYCEDYEFVLCQDCLRVRPYTHDRHVGIELCECGGEFCGCDNCNSAASLLLSGYRGKDLFTRVDISSWSAEEGVSHE